MESMHAASIESRQKVFITIGHQTTMARALFFGVPDDSQHACTQARLGQAMFEHVGKFASEALAFDLKREYVFQPELYGIAGAVPQILLNRLNCPSSRPKVAPSTTRKETRILSHIWNGIRGPESPWSSMVLKCPKQFSGTPRTAEPP